MTHAEKLAAVRQKIVEACPELSLSNKKCSRCREKCSCDSETPSFFVIRLEHVLRALAHKEMKSGRLDIFIDLSFRFWKITNTNGVNDLKIISHWMPTKDLSGQPEATIDFLYSVFYSK